MKQIVVASGPLPLGTRLTSKDLRTIPWPTDAPVANMFAKPEDCENRALITSVSENEPILESKLAPVAAGAGLAATIPEGMRALSVAVNDVVSVAGFVTPGAMVDVLTTGSTKASGNITLTVLENVRVLAANQRIESRGGTPRVRDRDDAAGASCRCGQAGDGQQRRQRFSWLSATRSTARARKFLRCCRPRCSNSITRRQSSTT